MAAPLTHLLEQIGDRCTKAKLPHKPTAAGLWIELPSGRSKRPIFIGSPGHAQQLLTTRFERYMMPSNYRAICSYEDDYLEVAVAPASLGLISVREIVEERLLRGDAKGDQPRVNVSGIFGSSSLTMELGPMSGDLQALAYREAHVKPQYSLKITGAQIATHDRAIEVIERVGTAFLFQVDIEHEVALTFVRERLFTYSPYSPREGRAFRFPSYEYDTVPMSLYWHAQAAESSPLLRYLAFYQCIEFYFPAFYEMEAQRRVRAILKDPGFHADRDHEIARLLAAARETMRGVGDERSMLRATIQQCVGRQDLVDFIHAWDQRNKALSSKVPEVTNVKIPVQNSAADLRSEAADRIYEIRCRIVHAKAGWEEEQSVLLPFSEAEQRLGHDIDLIRFVARQVLVCTSSPLGAKPPST